MAFAPSTPELELLTRFTVGLAKPVWELGRTSDLGTRGSSRLRADGLPGHQAPQRRDPRQRR